MTNNCCSILLGVFFLFACSLQCISGSTSPDSSLGNVVLYSVAKNTNLNFTQSLSFANNIMQGLNQKGISDKDCSECKKRSYDYLIQLFKADSRNSDCLEVEKLLEGDSYNASVFAVTANISCVRPTYDSECFPSTGNPSCSWKQSFEPIQNANSDIFPKYAVNTVCKGCREYKDQTCWNQHRQCYTNPLKVGFHFLRRTNQCSDGYEVWVRSYTQHQINVACSCRRRRT